MLGGEALVGVKTPLAIAGYALMWILQTLGTMGTATGDKATTTGAILTALVSAFGALGVTAKFDRAFGALSTIAGILQKLPALTAGSEAARGGHRLKARHFVKCARERVTSLEAADDQDHRHQ